MSHDYTVLAKRLGIEGTPLSHEAKLAIAALVAERDAYKAEADMRFAQEVPRRSKLLDKINTLTAERDAAVADAERIGSCTSAAAAEALAHELNEAVDRTVTCWIELDPQDRVAS